VAEWLLIDDHWNLLLATNLFIIIEQPTEKKHVLSGLLFTIIEQPTENKLFTLNMIFQWVVH
jgi:hypothetical protein